MFGDLPLVGNAGVFALAAAIVWVAGTRLARTADEISQLTGLGQAAIGVLLLGSVTSLPEIAVAISATRSGEPELSVTNVLGSAAINVLVLVLADAAIGRAALTSTPGSVQTLLQGLLGIVLFAIVIGAVVAGDVALLGMGASSWALLAAYAVALRLIVHGRERRPWIPRRRTPAAPADPHAGPARTATALAWRTGLAAAAILAAGFVLAQSGSALAQQTGLGTSFVGAVFLSVATCLPEASTAIGAVRRGRYEMAIGDIFGTNLFNVMVIVLVDALHPGDPVLSAIGPFAAFGALLAMVLIAIYLVGMVERRDRTVWRLGADSLLALAVYFGGLVVLYRLR